MGKTKFPRMFTASFSSSVARAMYKQCATARFVGSVIILFYYCCLSTGTHARTHPHNTRAEIGRIAQANTYTRHTRARNAYSSWSEVMMAVNEFCWRFLYYTPNTYMGMCICVCVYVCLHTSTSSSIFPAQNYTNQGVTGWRYNNLPLMTAARLRLAPWLNAWPFVINAAGTWWRINTRTYMILLCLSTYIICI